jgi:hypothetical protein
MSNIKRKPAGYWSIERCHEESLKYNTRKEFSDNSMCAYSASVKKGWLDEICQHMEQLRNPKGFWNFDRCQEEANKYESRWEFQKGSIKVYSIARYHNWLDIICNDMERGGNKHNRCIYACEFPDNHVYIGLTYDMKKRNDKRIKDYNDIVTIYKNKTGLTYEYKQLTDYVDSNIASKLEGKYFNEYEQNGWVTLNRIKTGSLGGSDEIWTKEICSELASNCKTRKEFIKLHIRAYEKARKYKWLDEICIHMPDKTEKPSGYWNYERCKEVASEYNNRSEFQRKEFGAYNKARINNWLNDICQHMKTPNSVKDKPNGYWNNKTKCANESKKYENRNEFRINSTCAYNYSRKNGWLDEFFPKISNSI